MPRYRVDFSRTVTSVETVTRVIEAENKAEAQALAEDEAEAFNHDCPDDTMIDGAGDECGSWSVDQQFNFIETDQAADL